MYLIVAETLLDVMLCFFGHADYLFSAGGIFSACLVPVAVLGVLMLSPQAGAQSRADFGRGGPLPSRAAGKVGLTLIFLGHALYVSGSYWRATDANCSEFGADAFYCDERYAAIRLMTVVLIAPGFILLARALARRGVQHWEFLRPVYPERYRARHRLPLLPRFTSPPSFPPVFVFATLPILIILWLLTPLPTMGIRIHLASAVSFGPPPWNGATMLRMDAAGKVFLNSQKILPQELRGALKAELSHHDYRVVYLEADPELNYQQVISVMDAIRAVHANIFLLTPKATVRAR